MVQIFVKNTSFLGAFWDFWGRKAKGESLRLVASALESGVPLREVLEMAAQSAPWQPFRHASFYVLQSLSEGRPLAEAFGSDKCAVLPGWVRVILGSSMSDREKGSFLISHQMTLKSGDMPNYFPIFVFEILFSFQFFLAFNMFILPQFREIFLGMGVDLPRSTRMMMDLFGSLNSLGPLFAPLLFVGLAAVLYLTVRFIWPLLKGIEDRSFEIIMVTRFLGRVEQGRIPKLIEEISHPAVLPFSHPDFSRISESLKNGILQVDPFPNSSIEKLSSWAFGMALAGRGIAKETFSNLADLEEKTRLGRMKRFANALETCMVILISSMVGFFAISFFLCMIKLVEVSC